MQATDKSRNRYGGSSRPTQRPAKPLLRNAAAQMLAEVFSPGPCVLRPSHRLFGGVRGLGNAPRVVFFLGVGNSFQRGLVSLVVRLLLFLDLFLIHLLVVAALRPLAAHLCMRWCRDQRKHGRCNCKRPHHRTSPPSLSPETLCNIG